MIIKDILKYCDHTILKQTATWNEVREFCDDAYKFNTASVCIHPSFVHKASHYVEDQVEICTVIGYPNGYNSIRVKEYETAQASDDGANEIDAVINIGMLKSGNIKYIANELNVVRKACSGKLLKVVIEPRLLSENEKIEMCKIVTDAGADYIVTSSAFTNNGALLYDTNLFKTHAGGKLKIKVAGDIRTAEDAEKFISSGCSRLGTSTLIKAVKNLL